ncbi:MAG: carbohydrate-binding family 9-like protein [Gemmataceae bacterium]
MSRYAVTAVIPLGLTLLAFAAPPTPADPAPKGYVCHRANGPLVIDGRFDEPSWAAVPWSDPFGDIEGAKKPAPRFRTRVKMLWDDEALYIAAELEEPHVWANLTDHDAVIFQDPDFEVFLDPDADSHLYAELELNARNTTWDLLLTKPYKDGGKAVNGWEIIGLKTAVHVNGTLNDPRDSDIGWTVEIRWPWAGLKEISNTPVPPRDGDQWRINFSRVEWDITTDGGKYQKVKGRPEHNWVWSPQGVIDMHRPERWGYLQFSTAAPGTVALKPDPTAAARDTLHRLYYAQREYRAKHGKYAGSADILGLPGLAATVETTSGGFEATLPAGGKRARITHDARVTVE